MGAAWEQRGAVCGVCAWVGGWGWEAWGGETERGDRNGRGGEVYVCVWRGRVEWLVWESRVWGGAVTGGGGMEGKGEPSRPLK